MEKIWGYKGKGQLWRPGLKWKDADKVNHKEKVCAILQ